VGKIGHFHSYPQGEWGNPQARKPGKSVIINFIPKSVENFTHWQWKLGKTVKFLVEKS